MIFVEEVILRGIEDSFTGTKFDTPKGGVLTVLGHNGLAGNKRKYFVECNICSKDEELFPDGFVSSKGNLLIGRIPCGCAVSTKWTEDQRIVQIKRKCEERGYDFLGLAEEFKGGRTKLKLYNPKTNNTWESSNITGFLRGSGDPIEGFLKTKEASTSLDEVHIEEFIKTGKFLEGTTFTRNTTKKDSRGRYPYWDVICPLCSDDEYVKNRVCSGIFSCATSHLKRGKLTCRCSKTYRWTQDQREYQIGKVCSQENLTFIGWEGEYKNCKSKFNWKCSEGHRNVTSLNDFLKGIRCTQCFQEYSVINGYYPDRTKEQDYLYIYYLSEENYLKVGRSFNLSRRQKENQIRINNYNPHSKIRVLKTFTGTHKDIYDLEQKILSDLKSFQVNGYGSSELLSVEALPSIWNIINSCQEVTLYQNKLIKEE